MSDEIYQLIDDQGKVLEEQVRGRPEDIVKMIRNNRKRYGSKVQMRPVRTRFESVELGPGEAGMAGTAIDDLGNPLIEQPFQTPPLLGADTVTNLSDDQMDLLNIAPKIEDTLVQSGFAQPGQQLDFSSSLPFWHSYDLKRSPVLADRLAKLQERGYRATVVPDPVRGRPRIVVKDQEGKMFLVDNPYSKSDAASDWAPQPEELIGGAVGSLIPLPGSTAVTATGPSRLFQLMFRGATRAGMTAGGEAAGTAGRIGVTENARDIFADENIQSAGPIELLGESAETFGVGLLGEIGGEGLGMMLNPIKRAREIFRRNLITMGEFERRALRAQEGLDLFGTGNPVKLPELSAAYAHPIMRIQLTQAAGVSGLTRQELEGTVSAAFSALKESTDQLGDITKLPMEVIDDLVNRHERDIKQKLASGAGIKGDENAFMAIRDGIQRYDTLKGIQITNAYEEAKLLAKKERPLFDLTHAANTAETELLGISFPTTDFSRLSEDIPLLTSGRYEVSIGANGMASVFDRQTEKLGIYAANGTYVAGFPFTKDVTSQIGRAREAILQEVKFPKGIGVHKTIHDERLIHILQEITSHARDGKGLLRTEDMDLVRSWRTDLFMLTQEGKAGRLNARDYRTASRLHQFLTYSMQEPIGASREFKEKLFEANSQNALMENVTDSSFVQALLQTDADPVRLGREHIDPGNIQTLNNLRSVLKDEFSQVQNGYIMKLMDSPENIENIIAENQFKPGWKMLVDAQKEKALREYGREWRRFHSGMIYNLAKTGYADGADLFTKISQGKTGDIAEYVESLGGKNSPRGRNLQAVFLAEILEAGSVEKSSNRTGIDPKLVVSKFRELRNRGVLDSIFDKDQMDMLEDVNAYLTLLPVDNDLGSSLVIAGLASSTKPGGAILHPYRFTKGTFDSMGYYLTGRALLSPEMKRIWKSGKLVDFEPMYQNARRLAAFTSVLATTRAQADADARELTEAEMKRYVPESQLELKDGRWNPPDLSQEQLLQNLMDRGIDPRGDSFLEQLKSQSAGF